jgi:hypothetical protein
MVINPVQGELIKLFQGILEYNGVAGQDLYFSPLVPFSIMSDLVDSVGAKDAKEMIENPNGDDLPDTQGDNPTDGSQNPNETIGYVTGPENTGSNLAAVNENLKNLTGRQYQHLMRIVNQFQRGKINQSQAVMMLKSAFGLAEDEAITMLGIETPDEVQMSKYEDIDYNAWQLESNYEISNNN